MMPFELTCFRKIQWQVGIRFPKFFATHFSWGCTNIGYLHSARVEQRRNFSWWNRKENEFILRLRLRHFLIAIVFPSGGSGSYTVHSTQYTVHSAQCTVHSTQCTVQSTQYTVHSTQCTVHSAQYTVHSAQYTVHSTQCTVHSAQCTVHSAQCTVHSAQYTVHSAQYTVHSAQYTVYSTQCTVHSAQYTVHSTQCTVHSTQYTVHSTQYTVHSTQYTVLTSLSDTSLSGGRNLNGTNRLSVICYKTKAECWQHYRNREDFDDDTTTVKVALSIVSPWVGGSLSQNHHREALQNEILLR